MLSKEQYSAAFSEWMRRFVEDPTEFQREFQSVNDFNADSMSYGDTMANYFISLL